MFNAGIIASSKGPSFGEVILTSASGATGTWVCPAGVTRVCVVLVGRGGTGRVGDVNAQGAGGGALTYKNDVAVVPGQSYSYGFGSVGSGKTTIFGLEAGNGKNGVGDSAKQNNYGESSVAGDPTSSRRGGNGAYPASQQNGQTILGGSAATYTANGAVGGDAGVGLFGTGSTGDYGRGGHSSVFLNFTTPGGPGGIRIIWGTGRSFPSNAQ